MEPIKSITNIVWFKKDLRVLDHQALFNALKQGPTLGLFLWEDEWLQSPEFSEKHLQFASDCLSQLAQDLAEIHVPLIILRMKAVEAFSFLKTEFNFTKIFSHQETGLWWTYQRDLKVKSWCQSENIVWLEYLQFSVVRNLKNRDLWNQQRLKIINRKIVPTFEIKNSPLIYERILKKLESENIKSKSVNLNELKYTRNTSLQRGGASLAHQELSSFLSERIFNYQKGMSSPVSAVTDCSRLSPHIAWGAISLSEIQNILNKKKSELDFLNPKTKSWLRNLKSFESRLWWHCHFIQKLESEPEIEFQNMNAGFDGMRENEFNPNYFEAWKTGQTGFPFIDACMRCLQQTGWINFRMRALLISFASYQLWLHWKKPATHLAQLFTDFEPGIHFSQIQMQSGVTGINTIRMYSAIKQSMDQDPNGVFIKKYCPELEGVDVEYIHQPHLMPPMIQIMSGVKLGVTYPEPIVDHKQAYTEAKQKIYKWRSSKPVKDMAKGVYQKHGSRKNNFFPLQKRT